MSFNFDRRTFLKGAGAVGAASLLAACGEKSTTPAMALPPAVLLPPTPPALPP